MSARVVIIDDDELVGISLGRLLKRRGFEVRVATSGAEGLALLAEFHADAVLCDYRMPGMLGTQVLRELKVRSPRTIRIMVSGYADVTAAPDFAEADIFELLSKPWDDDELVDCLERALAQRPDTAS